MIKCHEDLCALFFEVLPGILLLTVLSILLAAVQANASEKYIVNAFLVESTESHFTQVELNTIGQLKKLASGKADLRITEMEITGKLKKLNFRDFCKGRKCDITVALFPASSGMVQIGYAVKGGFFLAATPKEALTLLKKYL